jgi:hypothetical protein
MFFVVGDPDQLSGESGYYLTVFTSVLEFLKRIDVSGLTANGVQVAY